MSPIANIILIPNPDYVTALLGDPDSLAWRLGERPAVAERRYEGDAEHNPMGEEFPDWAPNQGSIHGGRHQRALILVWEGVAIEQSWDRAFRVRGGGNYVVASEHIDLLAMNSKVLEFWGLGRVVFLDDKFHILTDKGRERMA